MKKQVVRYLPLALSLSMLLGVNECSQESNLTATHMGNFFAAPFYAVKDWWNNDTQSGVNKHYDLYQEKPTSTAMPSDQDVQNLCEGLGKVGQTPLEGLGKNLLDSYCHCQPWDNPGLATPDPKTCHQSCPNNILCAKLCPKDLSILRREHDLAAPLWNGSNSFDFVNSAFDVFPNAARLPNKTQTKIQAPPPAYGLGMVAARRKFNHLAFFQKTPVPTFNSPAEQKSYYLKKIDSIFSDHPEKIEGYSSLQEFSADPLVQKYLKQKIADEWLARSVGRGLSEQQASPQKTLSDDEAEHVFNDAEKYTQEMNSTTLVFGFKSSDPKLIEKQPVHGVEVYKTFTLNGQKTMCIHDPNYASTPPEHSAFSSPPPSCHPSIKVDSKKGLVYSRIKKRVKLDKPEKIEHPTKGTIYSYYKDQVEDWPITDARLDLTNDKKDAVHQVPELHSYCLKEKKCN